MNPRRGVYVLAGVLSTAAGCEKKPPPSEQPTEPWPAPAVSSAAQERAGIRHDYVLAPGQKVSFELKTRASTITGEFPVLRGSLSIDLMNLQHSDAKLEVDVAAARITLGTENEMLERSMIAHNWLGVGSSVPESDRDALRWASVLIESVSDAKVSAAHEAKVDRKATQQLVAAPPASATLDTDAAAPDVDPSPPVFGPHAEVRSTRVSVIGSLQLNNRRVTEPHEVALDFYYAAEATPGVPPARIRVKNLRAMRVPLKQHAIEPKNSAGIPIAGDLKLLGKVVGTTALLTFSLEFVPKAGTGQPAP